MATALEAALHTFIEAGVAEKHVDAQGRVVWKATEELTRELMMTMPQGNSIVTIHIVRAYFSTPELPRAWTRAPVEYGV